MPEWTRMDAAQQAANAYSPTYDPTNTTPDWRGEGGIGKATSYNMYNPPSGGGSKSLLASGGITIGKGLLTPDPLSKTGFLVAGLIQIAGGVLGAIFGHKELTPEQEYFNRLCSFYSNLGKRSVAMRNTLSRVTGKPADSYVGRVGYRDAMDAFDRKASFVTSNKEVDNTKRKR
jgi:hypothetical protein